VMNWLDLYTKVWLVRYDCIVQVVPVVEIDFPGDPEGVVQLCGQLRVWWVSSGLDG
jgi:hypothetical protein